MIGNPLGSNWPEGVEADMERHLGPADAAIMKLLEQLRREVQPRGRRGS